MNLDLNIESLNQIDVLAELLADNTFVPSRTKKGLEEKYIFENNPFNPVLKGIVIVILLIAKKYDVQNFEEFVKSLKLHFQEIEDYDPSQPYLTYGLSSALGNIRLPYQLIQNYLMDEQNQGVDYAIGILETLAHELVHIIQFSINSFATVSFLERNPLHEYKKAELLPGDEKVSWVAKIFKRSFYWQVYARSRIERPARQASLDFVSYLLALFTQNPKDNKIYEVFESIGINFRALTDYQRQLVKQENQLTRNSPNPFLIICEEYRKNVNNLRDWTLTDNEITNLKEVHEQITRLIKSLPDHMFESDDPDNERRKCLEALRQIQI